MSETFENEIQKLKERNARVELDKAWEQSWNRRIFIKILTYFIAVLWLYIIPETHIWLKAVVPAVGYILSTLSISVLKKIWIKKYKKVI